jgi:hypothetical protein
MTTEKLTEQNFVAYALCNYFSDEHINTEEFNKSLKTITYINRLLKKDNNVNHRLILNHIIITANTFGIEAAVNMLLFKISEDRHTKIKTYLFFLNYLYDTEIMEIDKELLELLNNI